MTESIPVEKILGPNIEGNTNCQSIKEPQQGRSNIEADGSSCAEQNENAMARINWTCCKSNWFVYDGLGITCAGVTYGLIFYALFVVIGVILLTDFPASPWAYFHSILFTLLAVLAISAHARSMTTDPVSFKNFIFISSEISFERKYVLSQALKKFLRSIIFHKIFLKIFQKHFPIGFPVFLFILSVVLLNGSK